MWVRARPASSKGAWFQAVSGTNYAGGKLSQVDCVVRWLSGQSGRTVSERSWVRVLVRPCAFSSPATLVYKQQNFTKTMTPSSNKEGMYHGRGNLKMAICLSGLIDILENDCHLRQF